MSQLEKKHYSILENGTAEIICAGASTIAFEHEDGVLLRTIDPLKRPFLEELFKEYPDMEIFSEATPIKMYQMDACEFTVTRGTPLVLEDEYNYDVSVRRVFDTLNSCHYDELDHVSMTFRTEGEEIVWNASIKAIKAYKKVVPIAEIKLQRLDLHNLQYILSPNGDLVCIDPFD